MSYSFVCLLLLSLLVLVIAYLLGNKQYGEFEFEKTIGASSEKIFDLLRDPRVHPELLLKIPNVDVHSEHVGTDETIIDYSVVDKVAILGNLTPQFRLTSYPKQKKIEIHMKTSPYIVVDRVHITWTIVEENGSAKVKEKTSFFACLFFVSLVKSDAQSKHERLLSTAKQILEDTEKT